jgi:hypothetical protein
MKKLKLFLLFCVVAQLVHAQKMQDISGFGFRYNRVETTVFLTLAPRPDTVFSSTDRSFLKNGSAFFNTTDSLIYVFFNNRFRPIQGSGGGSDGNNYPTSISLSGGTFSLLRNGLSTITTTVNTSNVTEGTSLYFTTARARSSLSQGYGITYNSATGVIDADTTALFNGFNILSWDNSSLYDSSFWYKTAQKEARGKSIVKDWTNSGRGLVDFRVITDSTISHKLVPKALAVKSVAEIRALTDFVATDTQYIVKLTNYTRKFTQEYQYDPNDVSSTDDGALTIVAGTKRFKAVIKDYIDARAFSIATSASDNTGYIQAAVTAASTYSGTHTVLIANGNYPITGTITVPAGVTLKFTEGGMISGSGAINGGVIDGPMRAQLFTTGVTVHPDAVATVFSMMWYGAKGDGSDEVLKLQKCLDVCAYGNKIKHLYWPKGNYVGSKGLFWERDDNGDGTRDFLVGYTLEGETKGFDGGPLETSYTVGNGNSFGFGIQKGKGVVIKNIFLLGNNGAIGLLTPVALMENPSTNWTNGNSDNQVWPHAGWAIDPLAGPGTLSGNKYTDFSAKYTDGSNSGSTDILIENCGARYWVVGFIISPQGVIQNGDHVEYRNCWADFNKVAFATGSTQNRTNKITHCAVWGHVKTIIDCNTYGDNSGDPPHVSDLNCAGYNRELCRLNSFFNAGLFIKDSHFELLQMLGGNFNAEVGDLFIENSLVNLAGDNNPGDGTQVHHAKTIFRGGELSLTNCKLTNYSQGLGLHAFAAANAVFVNSTFDTYPLNNLTTGQTQFIHCRSGAFSFGEGERIDWVNPVIYSNQATLFVTDMDYVTQLSTRDIFASVTRKKINRTSGYQGYGFKDAQQIPLGGIAVTNVQDPETAVGYSHCEFTLSTSSAEFKYIQAGDIVITYSTDEFGRANVYHTFGTVLSKNGSTGLVVIRDLCAGVTATTYSLFLYKAQKLIPVFATGNITSGSTTISSVLIEQAATSFPSNVLLNSPYFPEGTVILSYDNGTGQITTSNPATATVNNIDILSSNWQGVVYGGPPSPSQVDKIGWKQGDINWNTRADVDNNVLFWVCSTSGITNTARQPAFKPVFKQQPPQLVDNTTADSYGVTFYYNTTSSVHRIKNGATWYDVPAGNIYTADGSLTGNRKLDASSSNYTIQFGDRDAAKQSGSHRIDADLIYFNGPEKRNNSNPADAAYTVLITDYHITLPTITANRVITLPSAATWSGRYLVFRNTNSTGFTWSFGTAVKDGADVSVTNLVNDTVYMLYSDGTNWCIEN